MDRLDMSVWMETEDKTNMLFVGKSINSNHFLIFRDLKRYFF